ncbi:hypothetical protein I6A60_20405 [Frankia sp. AgB1.9]|nr:hypothetical protein [Frankia sp. AgW1.1]MBL7550221.1 hypothetical protein [Frankia sp. AgB1.9]MBL7619882.1 hypothetical protein [Frankia sp. AgB1.8]
MLVWREPRRSVRWALNSSNIHFGISGSWTGLSDQTHFSGPLTAPCRDRLARRLNTW